MLLSMFPECAKRKIKWALLRSAAAHRSFTSTRLLVAAVAKSREKMVASVAPSIPSVRPMVSAASQLRSQPPQSIAITVQQPTISAVASRCIFRSSVIAKATASAISPIISDAASVANAKSKTYPKPVRRYSPATSTVATAAPMHPATAPRHASGPGRTALHCFPHQFLVARQIRLRRANRPAGFRLAPGEASAETQLTTAAGPCGFCALIEPPHLPLAALAFYQPQPRPPGFPGSPIPRPAPLDGQVPKYSVDTGSCVALGFAHLPCGDRHAPLVLRVPAPLFRSGSLDHNARRSAFRAILTPPPARKAPPQHPAPAATDQEQFISYWTTETGWNSELQLRNNLESESLVVTPALRTAVGTETSLPPITIKPGEVASLDLYKTLLQSAPSLVGSWGSLVLRYRSAAHRALYAALVLRADGRPMVFHLDAYERGKNYDSGHREGIWWLPWETVSDYLILTNSGDQPLQPALQLSDSTGASQTQMLTLAPFETRRLSVRTLLSKSGLSGSYGGIKITAAKNARYLDSVHLLFEESGNFSALMKMFKHDPRITAASRSFGGVSEWTIRAPMLALTHPDPALAFPTGTVLQPKVFLRNASGRALTAHLHFNWRSSSTAGKTAPIDLAFKPNETKLVDVAALQDQNVLPPDAYWAAVIVSAPVQPDELLAVAASYDQTGRYGAQTPFSDQLASHWEAGKWEVDGTHDSLITIANGSNKPAVARLTILYHQGSGSYQIEQPLAPDEQMWVDFGKLIHEQIPDKNGATLPPDLTEGTYRLVDLNDNPLGSLYEGKVIVDKTFGHATYGCMICCGPNNPWMMYDPLPIAISDFENQDVQAINSCSNRLTTVTSDFPSWWTDNSSIATATGRQINGIAVGTTNHNAQSQLMYWGDKEDSGGGACPLDQPVVSAPTNVTPHIDSISPAQGPIGQTTNGVTISGRGFGASPTVNAGPNITVTITSKTDAQIVANFAVSSTAAIGAQPVTVAVTGVPPSNSVNFGVAPRIDSVSPSRGLIGATTSSVTINGLGLSGAHVNTPATIQVQNITTATNTQITFDAVISSTATPGNNAAAISATASGETSTAFDFFVQVPTVLSIVPGTATRQSGLCPGSTNACQSIIAFEYQVGDQASPAQPIRNSMSLWDSFGSTSPDPLRIDQLGGYRTTCSPNQTNGGPCGVNTNTDGTFWELGLGACSPVCYSTSNGACTTGGPSQVAQTWHIASQPIVQQISIYCEKVSVNGVQVP